MIVLVFEKGVCICRQRLKEGIAVSEEELLDVLDMSACAGALAVSEIEAAQGQEANEKKLSSVCRSDVLL